MELYPCTNMVNPRPFAEHCPSKSMIEKKEEEFTFEYKGLNFRPLRPWHQCIPCATVMAKRWFDEFAPKLLKFKDWKLTGVRWSHFRSLRRKRKSDRARGIPQMDPEFQALQVLHDLGVLTRDKSKGWEVWDISRYADGVTGICPSLYKIHKLYFVDFSEAVRYCQTCLSPEQGHYKFELRLGSVVYPQSWVLNANPAKL